MQRLILCLIFLLSVKYLNAQDVELQLIKNLQCSSLPVEKTLVGYTISNNQLYLAILCRYENPYSLVLNLWKSDSTIEGTSLLFSSTSPSPFYNFDITDINGTVYFSAFNPMTGLELWKTNGTQATTTIVKDINNGSNSSEPLDFFNFNGILYFSADNGINGRELWRSDGTTVGTYMLKEILSGNSGSEPAWFTSHNDALFFVATGDNSGREIWRSDGTTQGTNLYGEIYEGLASSNPSDLVEANGILFCANAINLYKIGNQISVVKENGMKPYLPTYLSKVGNNIYFSAHDSFGLFGKELWKSDGTDTGTYMVKNINNNHNSLPTDFTEVNGTVFFFANDGINGRELWKSDGTEQGTRLVKVIIPGNDPLAGFSHAKTSYQNRFYFYCFDENHGFEPWVSDGTELGTKILFELSPGTVSGEPIFEYIKLNNELLILDTNNLYKVIIISPPCPQNLTLNSPIDDISSGTITKQSSATNGTITATNKISGNANVSYQARSILLNTGFKANTGTVFSAQTGGCQ